MSTIKVRVPKKDSTKIWHDTNYVPIKLAIPSYVHKIDHLKFFILKVINKCC